MIHHPPSKSKAKREFARNQHEGPVCLHKKRPENSLHLAFREADTAVMKAGGTGRRGIATTAPLPLLRQKSPLRLGLYARARV